MLYQLSYFRMNRIREVVFSFAVAKVDVFFELPKHFQSFFCFLFSSGVNCLLFSILSCLIELRLHRGVLVSELTDRQFFGVLIGESEVVFRAEQVLLYFQ